ncbi:MAG TPA: hypothetical protein VIN65_03295, partial [Candidatus Dormibacteraeota bacterium]
FDRFRDITPIAHVVDEYRNGPDAAREEHFRDWVHNVEAHVAGMPKLDAAGMAARVRELMELDYSIHFHVFRPDTFLEFLVAACKEGDLSLEPLEFIPCYGDDDGEFIFVFAKGIATQPPVVPRIPEGSGEELSELRDLLQRAESRLESLTQSRSWRMTAPLRAAVRRSRARQRTP